VLVTGSLAELRLRVKKAFAAYYLELCSPGIADPMTVFEVLRAYFAVRRAEVGDVLFALEVRDDVAHLAGEIEQDMRRRHGPAFVECLAREPLDLRFEECVRRVLAEGWVAGAGA
jgi:hypothetical protein